MLATRRVQSTRVHLTAVIWPVAWPLNQQEWSRTRKQDVLHTPGKGDERPRYCTCGDWGADLKQKPLQEPWVDVLAKVHDRDFEFVRVPNAPAINQAYSVEVGP